MDKNTAQHQVRETFKAAFDKRRYRDFINELCNGFDESKAQNMSVPDAFSSHVKSCQRLGTFESAEGELADVLIVHLTESYKLERTRTALRDFVAHKLKRGDGADNTYKEAGLVAFVAPDSQSWRFSFVRMDYETQRDPTTGKIKPEERLTPARRYSYLVGTDEECHTAQSRFLPLLQNTTAKPTLSQIEEAFSVESVTKEFFAQYAKLFTSTQEALDEIVKKDADLRADFSAKKVSTADFAKKLLGQIVFLYFIQKKGWLGVSKEGKWGDGPRNFMRQLVNQALEEKQGFFNDVLEPLFYNTLATDRGHDAWCVTFQCRIPFLNGGLFEPLAGYEWEKTNIRFSNSLFSNKERTSAGDTGSGILDVFDRYNFTVNEAEPLEKEVAIDPEMLGKVFENLIEENRRKGLGAYYTPREIVHYMCQESLINYLDTTLNLDGPVISKADIDTLIREGEQAAHYEAARKDGTTSYIRRLPKAIEQYARELDNALKTITVCDPAIGSGAFPVGMMTEIVRARVTLTPYFNDVAERTPYYFKRHAIQNSLYGVDIDIGAVEIAKLRLWLSLVVDEDNVQQIKPLPNLDYKVVVGNSLMCVEKNLFNNEQFNQLEILKPKFFDESNRTKKEEYKSQIEKLIHELTNGREFFDFEIFFSEIFNKNGGFDVVTANPPYLGEKGNKETFRPIAASSWGARYYKRKMDLFYYFFHLALDLVKTNGSVCFITTSYWITADGAYKLRSDLKERATLLQLLNFGELRLFATAQGQHNLITHLVKNHSNDVARTLMTRHSGEARSELIKSILAGSDSQTVYYQNEQYQIYDGAENQIRLTPTTLQVSTTGPDALNFAKIDDLSRPLSDYAEYVFMGVQTGCDIVTDQLIKAALEKKLISTSEARHWIVGTGIYVLSSEEIDALHLTATELRDCVKPFYKNSDIERYCTPQRNDKFLLYVDSKIDINRYPHIKMHLEQFRPLLAAREQAVIEPHNWFWIRGAKRDSFFYRTDILVVPYRAVSSRFSICNQDIFGAGDMYFISLKQQFSTRALLGFLNSSLVFYHLLNRGKRKGRMIEYYKNPLEKIPIPNRLLEDKDCSEKFEDLVDKIIAAKQRNADADTNSLEQKINALVYELYKLTPEEIQIIELTTR